MSRKRDASAAGLATGLAENGRSSSSSSSSSSSNSTGITRESAEDLRKKSKAPSTTAGYITSLIRYLKFVELTDPTLIQHHAEKDFKKIPEDDLIKLLVLPVPQEVVDKYLEKICFFVGKDGDLQMRGKSTPENWWSTMVFVYNRRRNEENCKGGMPGRFEFTEFVKGMCNKKASHAESHGKDREGKEAFTKKALYVIQRNSLDTDFTSLRQMAYCPLLGSAAINTGLRIVYNAHIAFCNISFEVSCFFVFILLW